MATEQGQQTEQIVQPLIVIGRSEHGHVGIDLCGMNPAAAVVLLMQTVNGLLPQFKFDAKPNLVQPVSDVGLPNLKVVPR